MEIFKLYEDFIHLNQLLKALSWCSNGAEANELIDSGKVKVNGAVEIRRRNKIRSGFSVELGERKILIASEAKI